MSANFYSGGKTTVKQIPQKLQTLITKGIVGITDSDGREFCIRILDYEASESLLITQNVNGQTVIRVHITLNILSERSHMTTTVLELIENLKHYPGDTVVTIKDVDDEEFAIVGFNPGGNTVTIVIGEKVDSEPEEEK